MLCNRDHDIHVKAERIIGKLCASVVFFHSNLSGSQANTMTIFLGSLVLVIFSLYIAVESIGRNNIQPCIKPRGYGKLVLRFPVWECFTSVNCVFQHISKNTAQIYVGDGKLVWKINIQIDINISVLRGGN